MGDAPYQYTVIEAAKWLGVAPWDLMQQPVCWITWALNHKRATETIKPKGLAGLL